MKAAGYNVELVTEFAKELHYEQSWGVMGNQLALLGEQDRRLQRLVGTVDYAITDSPILMGLAYAKGRYDVPWFTEAVTGAFDSYENLNFFVRAVKPYSAVGRRQSEHSARALDDVIVDLLQGRRVHAIDGDDSGPEQIFGMLPFFRKKGPAPCKPA